MGPGNRVELSELHQKEIEKVKPTNTTGEAERVKIELRIRNIKILEQNPDYLNSVYIFVGNLIAGVPKELRSNPLNLIWQFRNEEMSENLRVNTSGIPYNVLVNALT